MNEHEMCCGTTCDKQAVAAEFERLQERNSSLEALLKLAINERDEALAYGERLRKPAKDLSFGLVHDDPEWNPSKYTDKAFSSLQDALLEQPQAALAALKAEWQAEAIPNFIREIGNNLCSQNNRITADPLFCVFEKEEIPADPDSMFDGIEWRQPCNDYSVIDPDSDTYHRLEALYEAGRDINPDKYQRCAYVLRDKFVTAALTEAGAKRHIELNGHNLRSPHIYVTSLFRTPEMIELRDWLMAQSAQEAK